MAVQLDFFRLLRGRLLSLSFGDETLVGSCRAPYVSSPLLDTSTLPGDSRRGGLTVVSNAYGVLLKRKTILMQLQFLLFSTDVIEDVKFAYGECKKLCMAVRNFNINHCGTFKPRCGDKRSVQSLYTKQYVHYNSVCKKILYSDIMEIYTNARSTIVLEKLLHSCSAETVLKLAEFENSFLMAFIGIVATFTHTLDAQNSQPLTHASDELYSSTLLESNIAWKNLVLTGEPAVRLKPLWNISFCKLWSKVTRALSSYGGSLLHGGEALNKFQSTLADASHHIGFDFHPEVQSCLRQVTSFLVVQKNLQKWDNAFQQVMVMHHTLRNKGYREVVLPMSNSQMFLESAIHEDICRDFSDKMEIVQVSLDKPSSVILHIEIVKQTAILCSFLQIILGHLSLELQQCVRRKLFLWDLPNLAWLLTCGVPQMLVSAKKCVSMMQFVSCPRLDFPTFSAFRRIVKRSQIMHEELYHHLTNLQEVAEHFYTIFYEQWQQRCCGIIQSCLPSAKQLRKAIKRRTTSHYCGTIIEELFTPLVKTIQKLPDETQQKKFAYLFLSIFYNIFRKAITSANKTYLVPPIAEQLFMDITYLERWIASSERELESSVSNLIRHLPILLEIKTGLQTIIGKPSDETDGPSPDTRQLVHLSINHRFPVFTDISWNSHKDWIK